MTIVTASGAAFWGRPLPAGVAYAVGDHAGVRHVTYAELGREKRERQARQLAALREVQLWRPVRLWVAYFDQPLMGGWHAFVEGYNLPRVWVIRDASDWMVWLMEMFPQSLFDRWDRWMPAFARTNRVKSQDRKPFGVAYLWHRGHELRRERPTE